jgi:hypothetical protein
MTEIFFQINRWNIFQFLKQNTEYTIENQLLTNPILTKLTIMKHKILLPNPDGILFFTGPKYRN